MRALCWLSVAAVACTSTGGTPSDAALPLAETGSLEAEAPFDAGTDALPPCATKVTFFACDGGPGDSGACRMAPPLFDGGGTGASYPAGCTAYYECPTQGCTCIVTPTSGAVWSCTLK